MKSIQHVLWRGALALTLMAIGIGTGVGMPPADLAEAARLGGVAEIIAIRPFSVKGSR